TRIEIEIRNGGRQLIRVSDDGCGMDREDAVLAIERHTTSKINTAEDLLALDTLGFRGEALATIAAVSQFELTTKAKGEDFATQIEVKGGLIQKVKDVGAPDGTTVKVQELFFNTPARLKYLKTIPTETTYIGEIISRLALSYPEISFRLQHHEYELLFTPGKGDLYETIIAVFGAETAKDMIPVSYQENSFKISGYIGKPSIAKNNRGNEIFFVNHRYFHSRTLSAAVEKAFHTLLPIARYPFVILFLEIDPQSVDVNVHPTKMEVRFSNDSDLFKAFYHSIRKTLTDNSLISEWIAPEEDLFALKYQSSNQVTNKGLNQPAANLAIDYHATNPSPTAEVSAVRETSIPINEYQAAATVPKSSESLSTQDFYVFPKAVQKTYIIAQDEKGLLFIDQHAAHERILFERYMNRTNEFLGSQSLLIPETVNLNYAQFKVVSDRLPLFADLGFEIETFGGQTIILRSAPLTLVNLDYQQIIIDLIDQFINFETFKDPAEIKEAFITTMACRTAIKAGDNLNHLEMEALVKDLFKCENSYTCPHGRPTVFRISHEEMAKKFLRR
ncbi:MAG: DNA mismatch repair endonuclease MutL, partial [Firmicutes bacterium]|nr:DNA mismatch repair endonuclease MutL [Bacillota bacterium]